MNFMEKEKLKKYSTKYQQYIIERFADSIPDVVYPPNDENTRKDYNTYMSFICILEASEQYQVEDKIVEYLHNNQNATIEEVSEYFDSITPDGLPPCASEWEDDEDDE